MNRIKALARFAAVAACSITPLVAGNSDRPYDFTDAYYLKNGVNPTAIFNRVNGTAPRSVIDVPYFASQRNIRVRSTNPAYSDNGNMTFWTVLGDLNAAGFTNDAAGKKAKELADKYILYVFPTKTGNPIGLGNNRQADIVDLRNGYFSNDPLGLWLHVWVSYTDKAFNTSDGKKMLADLEKKNGLALDGTPIIRTASELENLLSKGFAAKRLRKSDGSEGPMYGICPVIKDPTNGGIAPDAFLNYVKKADGTPLEPYFVTAFNNLLNGGTWTSSGSNLR